MNYRSVLAGVAVAAALVLASAAPGRAAVIGATVGTSASTVLAAPTVKPHTFVQIQNEATDTTAIACTFGSGTPALNSAGSYTIPAGGTMTWSGTNYRSWDPINCIAGAAGTPVTIEYQ